MEFLIFISSLLLSFIILFPFAKKFEIRKKLYLIGILIIGCLIGISTILVWMLREPPLYTIFLLELGFLGLFTGIISLYRFYRDPVRISPDRENIILAPADGFIRYIKLVSQEDVLDFDGIIEPDGWLIGITMTYLDVHITRSPIDGKILLAKHTPGKFISLKREKALRENKRAILVIEQENFKIGLTLIASRMVRKILLWVKKDNPVKYGERLGKIVFGSQTDIIIPKLSELKINVHEGEQVYAGLTILAEYQESSKLKSQNDTGLSC